MKHIDTMRPLTDNTLCQNGYALGWFEGKYWIGVVFGKKWKVARETEDRDLRDFGIKTPK